MDITLRDLGAMRLAASVTRAPGIDFMGAWKSLHAALQAQGLGRPGALRLATFRATALDGPASMQWYAGAMTVQADQAIAPPLEEQHLAPGRYAVGVYVGPYEGLGRAWGDLVKGLHAGGHAPELGRPCLEIYVSDPAVTPPAELVTELCVPVGSGA